jgi:DNA-directed RNA polymerase subunit RPC12/RpoP
LKSPIDDAGKPEACPQCGSKYVVPGEVERDRIRKEEAAAEGAKQRAKEQREEAQRKRKAYEAEQLAALKAQRLAEQELAATATRRCPYCGEEILVVATKCKHCGEFLNGERRQPGIPPTVIVKRGDDGCSLVIIIALGIVLGVVLLMFL